MNFVGIDLAWSERKPTGLAVLDDVGGLIHLYATAYMEEDPAFWRFFMYLNLFTFSMLTLVLGDNLVAMEDATPNIEFAPPTSCEGVTAARDGRYSARNGSGLACRPPRPAGRRCRPPGP